MCTVSRQIMKETLLVQMLGTFRASAHHATSVGTKRKHYDEARSSVK